MQQRPELGFRERRRELGDVPDILPITDIMSTIVEKAILPSSTIRAAATLQLVSEPAGGCFGFLCMLPCPVPLRCERVP